ncbi:transmembrane emp24 domain-containing protein 3-like [Mya arenaria]|uniref:transmembrane emp24 domain-containing protein 3-like n=1 Tax=Mya arenaria TaxID=6604 RepID=UPI0022E8B1F5|nr:transmembrane emp24 domain-containing protein 3-like [Mya arenaria]
MIGLCFVGVLIMCSVSASGTALMFELPDRKRFCLSEEFEGPKDYVLEYRVMKGGKNDVDVSVRSPNGKIIHKKSQVKEGKFEFETSRGDYQFCFSNEFSSWVHKTVFFDLRPADINSLAGEAGNEVPFVRNSAENSCDEIHETMTSVMRYQRDFRIKESIGRHIAETVHSHVTWVSLLQTFAILLTGLGQSFLLKRFFTEKSSDSVISSIKAET